MLKWILGGLSGLVLIIVAVLYMMIPENQEKLITEEPVQNVTTPPVVYAEPSMEIITPSESWQMVIFSDNPIRINIPKGDTLAVANEDLLECKVNNRGDFVKPNPDEYENADFIVYKVKDPGQTVCSWVYTH